MAPSTSRDKKSPRRGECPAEGDESPVAIFEQTMRALLPQRSPHCADIPLRARMATAVLRTAPQAHRWREALLQGISGLGCGASFLLTPNVRVGIMLLDADWEDIKQKRTYPVGMYIQQRSGGKWSEPWMPNAAAPFDFGLGRQSLRAAVAFAWAALVQQMAVAWHSGGGEFFRQRYETDVPDEVLAEVFGPRAPEPA